MEYKYKNIFIRICPFCKEKFKTGKSWQIYCSEICRNRHHYHYKSKKSTTEKICLICNKKFMTCYPFQKYCSIKCYQINAIRTSDSCIPHNLTSSLFKLRFELFKRDNFRCQYCGRNPRDNKTKLVIDHILPINKGGTNEINNLITSCEECNLGKSDILLEEHKLNKQMIIKNER